ncbi:hypothetical protein [Rheinheimera sp. 1928-s]|nr:hypothetical protein [Rheinheimera sp. 1928-s]MDF3125059.1 hypothetical protein [Rheinheimera sp. 1928-s]
MWANAQPQPTPAELAFSGQALGVKTLSRAWLRCGNLPDLFSM